MRTSTIGWRRYLISILLSLTISVKHQRQTCHSFSLSPLPIRTLLVDSVVTAFKRRGLHDSSSSPITKHGVSATKGDETTWSKTGQGGSRMGVRRRVRAVLDKARKRTGVANDSDEEDDDGYNSAGRFISETASLGLFDETPEVIFSTAETNAFTESFPRNDTAPPLVLESRPTTVTPAPVANGAKKKPTDVDNRVKPVGVQVDALLQAAPVVVDPLPFNLPELTEDQLRRVRSGERVQQQSKMAREGSGFVVLDIPAPAYAVWECLLDFEAYPENIGTVRSMRLFTNTHLKQSYIAEKPVLPGTGMQTRHYGTASISRAAFVLSKFRLKIAAIHRYQPHPDGHYMIFTLDKACTNAVLQDAKGIWYTQENPDGREGYTRIWLLCELKVSPMLPTFIVDYAAQRAMPRATNWLAPTVDRFCQKWFGPDYYRLPPK